MIEFATAIIVLVAVYLILQQVPLPEPFKQILTIVLGAVVVIYLLLWLGVLIGVGSGPPRLIR